MARASLPPARPTHGMEPTTRARADRDRMVTSWLLGRGSAASSARMPRRGAGAATPGREGVCPAGPGPGGDRQHPGGHSEEFVEMAGGSASAPPAHTWSGRCGCPAQRGDCPSPAPACLGWTPAHSAPTPGRPGVLAGPGSGVLCGTVGRRAPAPHRKRRARRGRGGREGGRGAPAVTAHRRLLGGGRAGGRPDGRRLGLRTEACAWADGVLRAFRWQVRAGRQVRAARAALRWFLAALLGLEVSSASLNSSRTSSKTLFPGREDVLVEDRQPLDHQKLLAGPDAQSPW